MWNAVIPAPILDDETAEDMLVGLDRRSVLMAIADLTVSLVTHAVDANGENSDWAELVRVLRDEICKSL
jgi:hypothetical protein